MIQEFVSCLSAVALLTSSPVKVTLLGGKYLIPKSYPAFLAGVPLYACRFPAEWAYIPLSVVHFACFFGMCSLQRGYNV